MSNNSIIKNAVFNVFFRLMNILFPLITYGYVARILTPEGICRNAAVQNNIGYFVILGSLGIQTYATREIAKRRDNKKDRDSLFSEMIAINSFMTFIAIIVFAICMLSFPLFKAEKNLYLICSLAIVINFINVDWFFQGIEDFRFIALRSFAVKLISLAVIFAFVHSPDDLYVYALICVLTNGAYHVISIIRAGRMIHFSLSGINIKSHFKSLFFLSLCAVSSELYARLDITMLDIIDNNSTVAFYTYSQKIVNIIVTAAIAVTAVFLPRLSYYYSNDKTKFKQLISFGANMMIFISLPISLGLASVAYPLIIIWLGPAYSEAASCLIVLALLIPLKCVGDIMCYQVLLCAGKERTLMVTHIATVAFNLIVNLILIPRFGAFGAAIASLLSEFICFLLVFLASRKLYDHRINKHDTLVVVFSSLVMLLIVIGLEILLDQMIIKLLVCVITGAGVYLILNVVCKNTFLCDDLLKTMRSKQL